VDEAAGGLQAELGDDVVLDGRGGGGGEGDDRRRAQGGEALAEHAVVRAKVVAPLRDAVGLVDGDQGRRALGQHLGEAGHAQALGGDEQEVELAGEVIDAGLARLGAAAAGVDALGAKALGARGGWIDPPSMRSAG
jgi:hypothetical protein